MPRTAGHVWDVETLGALLEASPDPMMLLDEAGSVLLSNARAEALFGTCVEGLVGEKVTGLFPGQSVLERYRAESVASPSARPHAPGVRLDAVARTSDGAEVPTSLTLACLETNRGRAVSVAIRDISAKRRELHLFRGLLEAAPDGMVVVDARGMIRLVNAQAERLFGYSREELIGEPIEILVPLRVQGIHQALREGYVADAQPRAMGLISDLDGRRQDGSEFPVEVSLAPLETEDGVLVSAAIRDISYRRRIQEQADRVKDEFFATVSHELRTPLTSIMGYGELLSEEELSPQGQRFLEIVMRSARRELRLVDDLLTLVAIDESGLTLECVELDLVTVVHESAAAAGPLTDEAGLELVVDVCDEPVRILGDRDRLGQVMDNLTSNAVKFTPSGGRVRMVLRTVEGFAQLDVVDTGSALDEDEATQIFDRLYRSPNAVASQAQGAGLGLSIARAIVEAHGGTIEANPSDASPDEADPGEERAPGSAEESGSVFRMRFPLAG